MSESPAPVAGAAGRKLFLIVTAALLLGWFAWLSYTALTKSREPIVSHAQASAAKIPVVATLTTEEQDREVRIVRLGAPPAVLKATAGKPAFIVTVTEQLIPTGPPVGSTIGVTALPLCAGYTGPGEYLLLLDKDEAVLDGQPAYLLVGQQRSPGADLESVGQPMIYRWGPDVKAQVKRLFPENRN